MPDDVLHLPLCKIQLPGHESPECWIMVDLAGVFGLEFNAEALDRLKAAWKERGRKGKVQWDHEADSVFIDAGRETIVEVAALIHELAGQPLAAPVVAATKESALRWKRPSPPPTRDWVAGDIGAIPLGDGIHAFFQILAIGIGLDGLSYPVVSLFESCGQLATADLLELQTSRTLTILTEVHEFLTREDLPKIGHAPLLDDPAKARSNGPGIEWIARAWNRRVFWNQCMLKDDYVDVFLQPGVKRPEGVPMLTVDQKAAIRSGGPPPPLPKGAFR